MENQYVIRIEPGDGCSEEYAPEKIVREGLPCSGYVLIGFDGADPAFDTVYGVKIMDLAKLMAFSGSPTGSILRQAAVIAEGLRKADAIRREDERKSPQALSAKMQLTGTSAERLREILLGGTGEKPNETDE